MYRAGNVDAKMVCITRSVYLDRAVDLAIDF